MIAAVALFEEIEDLEATQEQPLESVLRSLDLARERALIAAGLAVASWNIQTGGLARRQAE